MFTRFEVTELEEFTPRTPPQTEFTWEQTCVEAWTPTTDCSEFLVEQIGRGHIEVTSVYDPTKSVLEEPMGSCWAVPDADEEEESEIDEEEEIEINEEDDEIVVEHEEASEGSEEDAETDDQNTDTNDLQQWLNALTLGVSDENCSAKFRITVVDDAARLFHGHDCGTELAYTLTSLVRLPVGTWGSSDITSFSQEPNGPCEAIADFMEQCNFSLPPENQRMAIVFNTDFDITQVQYENEW